MDELYRPRINPQTRSIHRREVWWQIALPLLLGIALGALGLYGIFSGRWGNVHQGARVATVLLAMPFLILGLLFLVVTTFLIFAIGQAMRWIPTQTVRTQRIAEQIGETTVHGADLLAGPLLFFDSWIHAVSSLFRRR